MMDIDDLQWAYHRNEKLDEQGSRVHILCSIVQSSSAPSSTSTCRRPGLPTMVLPQLLHLKLHKYRGLAFLLGARAV
jgi:hypothetical protein